MNKNDKLLQTLNELLAEELTAINQYMVHSEMCANWGYEALHKAVEKIAIDEMRHAEWLIQRLLFLEGTPTVSKLNAIHIGKTVEEIVTNDRDAELAAMKSYNDAITIARDAGDNVSADLLLKILKMEEGHFDWQDQQGTKIAQMGLQNYLATQSGS